MTMKKCKILTMVTIGILSLMSGLMTYAQEEEMSAVAGIERQGKTEDWLPVEVVAKVPATVTVTGEGSKKHAGPLVRTFEKGTLGTGTANLFKDTKKIKIEIK